MRRILVTGANKGIGLAIARAILAEHDDTFVYLGARDLEKGRAAAAGLTESQPGYKARLEIVAIDVSDAGSVKHAKAAVAAHCGDERLYGIVNNAGIGAGPGVALATVLDVNVRGMQRVCEAFLPLLDPAHGRIANVTSAAGPSFVATCSPDRQRFFLGEGATWQRLDALMDASVAMDGDKAAFAEKGLGDGSAYGLSKACANTYTLLLAAEHPELRINACTPGFIETDMTRRHAEAQGKTPAEMGMKSPADGAKAPLHLLFGELEGNGRFYGSDTQRSPLDRYRSPGSPPYAGE